MPKLQTKKILAPERDFLAFPDHYVNIPGLIAFAELDKLKTTNKQDFYGDAPVIPRGTVVHIDGAGKITKPTYKKTPEGVESGNKANGVIFNTIKINDYNNGTDPFVSATVLVHGFVRKDRLYGDSAIIDAIDAPLIHIVNK